MIYLIFGLVLLALFLVAGRALTKVPAAKIAQHARFGGIALLVGLAGLLLLTGRVGAMSHVFALANHAMRNRAMFRGRPKGFDDVDGVYGAQRSSGGPTVSTKYLEMKLDQGTGEIAGTFIDGPWKGRALSACSRDELTNALGAMADDGESVRLLEAYLDRTFAGWREHHDQGASGRGAGTADAGGMAKDEAYEILGLQAGADADAIRAAHRRLMANIHPDRGGSTYLAAKVNLAKEVLLKLHG
ncbi:MAG: DnaJ domain-containing protein [Hyphomicrobiales bacterium]